MEETSKRSYKRFKYSLEDLQTAVQAVRDGTLSANKASKEYNIPKGTLINKLHGKSNISERKMGPPPVLSKDEEDRLELWILGKAKHGFPMHPEEVKNAVQKVLEEINRPNSFVNNRPGDKWLKLFLKRKPSIAKRNTEIISKARASVTEAHIRQWFDGLKSYLEEENALDILNDPDRIYNADETGVQLCPKTGKVLGPKKFRNFYDIAIGHEKESITVLANFSASGKIPPPMIVLPYQRIPKDVANSIPDQYIVGRSESGWMVGPTFFEYVSNGFYNWLIDNQIKFPILFLLDGHKSHINPELAEFCVQKQILLYCLLPNATHILQPCDVCIFRPLKQAWRKECQAYKQKTNKTLTKASFAPVFHKAFDTACKPEIIKTAFKCCGLYPFNVNNVDFSKCMSNRRTEECLEVTNGIPKNEAVGFIEILEKEISPRTLNKYKSAVTLKKELENDKLFQIWNKYRQLVNIPEDANSNMPIEERIGERNTTEETLVNNNNNIIVEYYDEFGNLINNSTGIQANNLENLEENADNHVTVSQNNQLFTIEKGDTVTNSINEENVSNESHNECAIVQTSNHQLFTLERTDSLPIDEENINNNNVETIQMSNEDLENTFVNSIDAASTFNDANKGFSDIWEKHLHYPKYEEKKKKRNSVRAPLAVTSKQWKQFYEEKEKEKQRQEQEKINRKLKRESIRNSKQKLKRKAKRESSESDSSETDGGSLMDTSDSEKENEGVTANKRKSGSTEVEEFTTADFVIIKYENSFFPGVIIRKQRKEYEIRVMHKSGPKTWKWPEQLDQIWYQREDIIEKIEPPKLVSSRGNSYIVPEMCNYVC